VASLQTKLSLKVSQRQILTPGLMQMVSVLALNKLELKEMIEAEMVENPMIEEVDESVPLLDEVEGREARLEAPHESVVEGQSTETADPFNEIDFGSYFQDYLDPGYRTAVEMDDPDRPSFENFLSTPVTLSSHLHWQLGSLILTQDLREACEFIIGNLNEDGFLNGTNEELATDFLLQEGKTPEPASLPKAAELMERAIGKIQGMDPAGVAARDLRECLLLQVQSHLDEFQHLYGQASIAASPQPEVVAIAASGDGFSENLSSAKGESFREDIPIHPEAAHRVQVMKTAFLLVQSHLEILPRAEAKEIARATGSSLEMAREALEYIRSLDPHPGQRYNSSEARLIEPDVAFVKREGCWVVVMNDEGMPSLRLNYSYRRLLKDPNASKEDREYVKERFRSALQLMRNISQRKSTILRTCEVIVERQQEFLERGEEGLKPMMIKEVAEQIGVHPSTISRAVSNKYVHTPQGVRELRFFFSEAGSGPEGSATPLLLLKRRVKKIIEEENPKHPFTDDQITALLAAQGIKVTRRTVAKYREDLHIPSTHQRRQRS
jgi:RNA polymerase sigma-54 factor